MTNDKPEIDMHDLCRRIDRKLGAGWCYNNCRKSDGTHSGLYTIDWCPALSERGCMQLEQAGVNLPSLTLQLHACISGNIVVSYFEWPDYPGPGASITVNGSISVARLCTKIKAFTLDCIVLELLRPQAGEPSDE